MTNKIRVPVLSPEGKPLMPTTSARARKWIASGKAKPVWNDLKVFCVQLLQEPSRTQTQKIVVAFDPGKLWSGCAAISSKAVLFTANLILPFKRVIARKQAQKILRRARRGRRINRNLPFELRAHREKRFDNRRGNKLPPSVRASKQLELRIIKELTRIFPVTEIVYEYVKADVDLTSGRKSARSGKGFSPVMVGQKYMLQWLEEIAPTYKLEGWQTSIIRKMLRLPKNKDKSSLDVSTHANDAIAAAASRFMEYKSFHSGKNRGHHWVGSIELTDSPFKVIARPQLYRRQHRAGYRPKRAPSVALAALAAVFENPGKNGVRKRKGGTVTPFGFRSGDYVEATKGKNTVKGYIGGYSEKNKVVSVYEGSTWRRIGQFSVSKTKLLKRSSGLCVA